MSKINILSTKILSSVQKQELINAGFNLTEANIETGKLNIRSPIARALIGKEEGDSVDVTTPGGKRSYEILTIRYV